MTQGQRTVIGVLGAFIAAIAMPGTVTAMCDTLGAGRTAIACASDTVMVMPEPCLWADRDQYAELVCHELGHVRGWDHQ